MKEKKAGPRIIIAAFIVMCILCPFWIVSGQFFNTENSENREFAAFPTMTLEEYPSFSKDFNAFFDDRIPFRNNLVFLNSLMDYFLFQRSSNTEVTIGKDNWLYLTKTNQNYLGLDLLDENPLQIIANNLMKQKKILEENGIDFVVYVAPNKSRIYPEYMSDRIGSIANDSRAEQIVRYLQNNTDICVISPYEDLMNVKELIEENIYYKTDTHWNEIGGYTGTVTLLKQLGIPMPEIGSDEISISKGGPIGGDLSNMLGLAPALQYVDQIYYIDGYDTRNAQNALSSIPNYVEYHVTDGDPRTVYMIRDSFGASMANYIGSQFSNTYIVHKLNYSFDDMIERKPDVLIYEIVERDVGEFRVFSINPE